MDLIHMASMLEILYIFIFSTSFIGTRARKKLGHITSMHTTPQYEHCCLACPKDQRMVDRLALADASPMIQTQR